ERAAAIRDALAAAPQFEATAALRARLSTALDAGPITLDTLPAAYTFGTVGKNGELALRIAPDATTLDARALEKQIATVRAVAPTATGTPVLVKMGAMGRRDYVPIVMPAILVVVTLVLAVAFRDWRDILLGLFPVVVGAALAFGAFFWFDLQFSVLTGFVVPVILGLGVDNGIHVVARLRQYPVRTEDAIHNAVEGVGRAIFLTTATTTLSFVSLVLSNHAGMESIAWFMLLGVPACFIASITVLPAAAKVLSGKRQLESVSENSVYSGS
ncbi:MAG: MMPL family transporter, partial [Candidatus Hydrogenedentales bacterium]